MMDEDIVSLLKRVRAGSLDAEHDIKEIVNAAVACIVRAEWRPIETAPVPSREEMKYGSWSCLLQDKRGYVVSGWGAYARYPGKEERYRIQWYNEGGRTFPAVYWMPKPAPKVET